ncbi:dipeptidyl aminopeptidase/acylaminoacyl peptidase [Streptacidiphilus sp. BW17]|uniref:S9 family peptidase n=1 Tax=unclassified Streptacidiphilus TaxID=2643834 RepID=UPI003518B144
MTGEDSGPIDASWVARKHTSYDELTSVGGSLWWLQSDPDFGGARRLVRAERDAAPRAQTPPGMSVGGWLHAYGGGSYAIASDCQWIISALDSKVYRIGPSAEPVAVVPLEDEFLYGDLHIADGILLAVRGTDSGDELVQIQPDGGDVRVLVTSPGFLGAPRLRGGVLAYLEWGADRMPWDCAQLHATDYTTGGQLGAGRVVAGGEHESVVQPAWGPDGSLYFLSDRTGWWNLYRWDGAEHAVAPMDADCGPAPWEGGYQSYAHLPGGAVALTVHDGFRARLVTVSEGGSRTEPDTGLTSLKPYVAAHDGKVAVIGATPERTPAVLLVDPVNGELDERTDSAAGRCHRVISAPSVRTVRSGGTDIRFLLHAPPNGGPAPLLVRAHPGPTDDVPLRLDWTTQFFTSRGFAVAEVAYRGSTGHGRAFRQDLNGHWGEYDVEDCRAVAEHLLAEGTALLGSVFISGASAGGYTALQAACQPGPFTAATATSAIVDPARWTATAPRFQRPHAADLAGAAGAVRAEAIRIPVLLIHGTADDVAPVSDAQALVDRLAGLGVDHEALILDGVGHYLSAPASLQSALEAEVRFYGRITSADGS